MSTNYKPKTAQSGTRIKINAYVFNFLMFLILN